MPAARTRSTIRERLQRVHLRPDPLGVPRNAFQVYLLIVVWVSGTGALLGFTTSGVAEQTLHEWARMTWAGFLVVGSTAVLLGMFWPGDNALSGLLFKRFGLVALMFASAVYGFAVAIVSGLGGMLVVGTTLGFAVACAVTAHRVNQRVHEIIGVQRG